MTERKPNNVSWESWIERQIRDGQRHGAFDQLTGHGRPIAGITSTHDDMWWVKAKLRDEEIDYLPPTVAIRSERENAIVAATKAPTEEQARRIIDDVNGRIRWVNSHATTGPPSTTVTIDIDGFLERWRAEHPTPPLAEDDMPQNAATPETVRRRWWHRLLGSPRPH